MIPNAVKIFLEASAEERARRSYVRNLNNEIRATLEQCLANINERDNICNSRKNPKDRIVCPRGAVRINTTKLSEEEVCTIAEKIIKRSTLVKKPVKKFKCKDVLE